MSNYQLLIDYFILLNMITDQRRYLLHLEDKGPHWRLFLYIFHYTNTGFEIKLIPAVIAGIFFKVNGISKNTGLGFKSVLDLYRTAYSRSIFETTQVFY